MQAKGERLDPCFDHTFYTLNDAAAFGWHPSSQGPDIKIPITAQKRAQTIRKTTTAFACCLTSLAAFLRRQIGGAVKGSKVESKPRESKHPIFEVSGSKNHTIDCIWKQEPQILGTWTLWESYARTAQPKPISGPGQGEKEAPSQTSWSRLPASVRLWGLLLRSML